MAMEFLDPKKQKQHLTRLIIGYVLVAMALLLTTVILLYRAYGFGLKDGEVIQNGLIFVSSRPRPADIYIDGKPHSDRTNTRVLLPAGQYKFELQRDGYLPWKRAITVDGGALERFDYAVLFPAELKPVDVKKYDVAPLLVTQSEDQKWILVQSGAFNEFDVYDTTKPKEAAGRVAVPAVVITLKGAAHAWQAVGWARDNKHVLLKHTVGASSEYIVFDRSNPAEAKNLTTLLGLGAEELRLRDRKYDKYYIFNAAEQKLTTATLGDPVPKPVLEHVLAFTAHDDKRIVYATDKNATDGQAFVMLKDGDHNYPIRQVTRGDTYLMDIADYKGDWFVVAGAPADNRTYVYKDPAGVLSNNPLDPLVPVQVLKTAGANFVDFSKNARFVFVENGANIAIYDAETKRGYAYALKAPIDQPQTHVEWMDGHRLQLVSAGQAFVFDFDDANEVQLSVAAAQYKPLFDRKYSLSYTFKPEAGQAGMTLLRTPLLTEVDQ